MSRNMTVSPKETMLLRAYSEAFARRVQALIQDETAYLATSYGEGSDLRVSWENGHKASGIGGDP